MDEKRYLIEILLKARETISAVAQKAANALDNVVKAEDRSTDASKRATKEMSAQRGALEQLLQARIREKKGLDDLASASRRHAESMTRTATAYRARSREIAASADALRKERDESVKLQLEHLNEARTLNELASATELQMGKANKQVASLRRQAGEHRRMADENRRLARSFDDSIKAIDRRARAVEKDSVVSDKAATAANKLASAHERSASVVARSINSVVNQITRLDTRQKATTTTTTRLGVAMQRLGLGSAGAASNLRGLNAELQGLALAATIKYAQSLISSMVALAAQLFAVAAAAGQAAIGIGAALTAGMAQAIPVAGVLAAALARVGAVMKAVKLQNQQQLTASHDAAAAARTQASAAESIRSAEERVADAHRNSIQAERDLTRTRKDAAREQAKAQRDVTDARKEAVRTVEDLIRAEEEAALSVGDAQAALRAAVRTGDVAGAARAEFDLRGAQSGLQRASADAAPVKRSGVEGVDAVREAEERLAEVRINNGRQVAAAERQVSEAMRSERRAVADLGRTRKQAADNVAQETAAVDKLADSLKLLSPAERDLYKRLLRLQEIYKRASRPITDIIVRAFSDVVDRVTALLKDPRILKGFRDIAVQVAESIRQVTGEVGGGKSVGVFSILSEEAARNIPIATEIALDLFRTLRNIVIAALPAFRLLLDYVKDYTGQASEASENTEGLSDFFVTGVKYARAFFELALSVVRLFLALSGQGGAAAEGIKTVEGLTDMVDGLTDKVNDSSGAVQDFFAESSDAFFALISIVGTLGQAMLDVFSSASVQSFADFLNIIIIPALANVVEIMGALVTVFHQFLTLPGVGQVASLVATFLLLAKGLTVIRVAVLDIIGIIPNFLRAMGLMEAGTAVGFAAMTPAGWVALAILGIVALIVLLDRKLHFLGPTFKWFREAASDAFGWLKEAAKDTVSWFSDVWTQGLLKWLRWPIVEGFKFFAKFGFFDRFILPWKLIIKFFGDSDGPWAQLRDFLVEPFRIAWSAIKVLFTVIRGAVSIFIDVLAGRFEGMGTKISGIWTALFSGMYEVGAKMINAMIKGLNLAISAFNALPGPQKDIPQVTYHMIESFDAKVTLDRAKAGKAPTGSFEGPHAQGGYLKARPGGRFIQVVEGGHDEVVITTDPKHGKRSQNLLGQLLERAPHLMGAYASGGWVQGAVPTPSGRPITDLAHALFARGFNVTSAFRSNSTTYHGQGNALDFGDSANNLRSLWSILYPQRNKFAELFGPTYLRAGGLYHGNDKFQDARLQAGHQDHVHVAMVAGLLSRIAGGITNAIGSVFKLPKILAQSAAKTLGGRPTPETAGVAYGALSALYNTGVGAIRDMRLTAGGTADGQDTTFKLGRGSAGRKIFDYFKGRGFTDNQAAAWVGNFMQEAGLDPSAVQPGGPGRGLAQWGGGRFSGLVAFARKRDKPWTDMQAQLDYVWHELTGSESAAYRAIKVAKTLEAAVNAIGRLYERFGVEGDRIGPARAAYKAYADRAKGGRFALGGAVPGYGGGDVHQIWAEGGEHVWSKDEVAAAGGHESMYAMRRMFGRGGSSRGEAYQSGGAVTVAARDASRVLAPLAKAGDAAKGLAQRIQRAFELLTEEGGPLDRLASAIESISTRAQLALQRRQFSVAGGVPTRTPLTSAQLAQANITTTRDVGTGLQREGFTLERSIATAREELAIATQRGDKKAATVARAAIENLKVRITKNAADVAQNAQDQVEAVESFQEELLNEVNSSADRYTSSLDRFQRTARALGVQFDPNRVLDLQIGNTQKQIGGLTKVLSRAIASGNTDLAQRVQDQINELNVTIAEAVAQKFQNSIDAVNNEAQRKTTRVDRQSRRAQAGGVNYGALQTTLEQRRDVLTTQRSGLQALMNQAAASGNIEQFNNLADQIDELDTALVENTYAIRDNTDAAFNARTQEINDRAGFSQSVFSGAQGFFQAVTQRTGVDTSAQQLSVLQGIATSLSTQRGGLLDQLGKLVGGDLSGLSGTGLVNYLTSIASGPALDAIMATLDPTQQAAFRDLVSALLGNATAVEQNTDAIEDLTGNNAQGFASPFWTSFRTAIFTGAGGLLTQYQMTIPGAAVGARVRRSGALMVHAGETVRPASVSRDWGSGEQGGDTFITNLTSPTEILDPVWHNRQLAFLRKTSGR